MGRRALEKKKAGKWGTQWWEGWGVVLNRGLR